MNGANGPSVSPLSASDNDQPYAPRYQRPGGSVSGASNDSSHGPPGPHGPVRSPPFSQHPSSSTDMSRPSQGGSSVGGGRPPSSASSLGGRSNGGSGFTSGRESTRSAGMGVPNEHALERHYAALRTYLAASLQDEKGNMKPNRARDKLLRLSVTQFMELSTDVYDELIRREDDRTGRIANVPRSLPPKQNFHPKRNQARQKLSTLPIERFRQLAMDVFYELERRIPRVAAGDMTRPGSAASSRAPSRGGMRAPPGAIRPPPPGMGRGGPMSPGGPNGMGPPIRAKTFQNNTMVPNKSTMVEDDEDDDEDEFGLDNVVAGLARRDTNIDGDESDKMRSQQAEIEDLKMKLLEKEQELVKAKASGQDDFKNLREELEQKHVDAQKLNDELRHELDQLHREKGQDERDIRAQHDRSLDDMRGQLDNAHKQMDDLHTQLDTHQSENRELRLQLQQGHGQPSDSELERRVELLQEELSNQEKITKEVREEATMLLQEMRDLSNQNDHAIEQEERLAAQVSKLEKEINEWRHRYARVKAQNKTLRASHIGLGLQKSFDGGSLARKEALVSENGLVKDVDVTRFQLSVEELLQVARQSSTDAMLDTVKNVAVCVQSITSVVGTDGYPTPSSPLSPEGNSQQPTSVAKLKARVTGTANSLITQTKLHSSSSGLSPVALLDAAASNLTSAVVELVKAVGIRPSPRSELEDADVDYQDTMDSLYDGHMSPQDEDDDTMTPNGDRSPPPLTVEVTSPTLNSPTKSKSGSMGSIGRNNTFKKMNGWFGWGKPTATEPPPTPSTPTVNGSTEYDPYR